MAEAPSETLAGGSVAGRVSRNRLERGAKRSFRGATENEARLEAMTRELQAELESSKARLIKCKDALGMLDAKVVELRDDFSKRTAEAEALKVSLQKAEETLGAAQTLLEEVAWRVQLMQNHPEIVGKIVPFARSPYYANSDDQTLLNDAIVGAVIGNRTFLGSTARYEGRNRYNPKAPEWKTQREANQLQQQMRILWKRQRTGSTTCPWDPPSMKGRRIRYMTLPIEGTNGDSVALAPRTLFGHLPYSPASAIIHLTAARGFNTKVSVMRRISKWNPFGSQEDTPPGATFSTIQSGVERVGILPTP